MGTVLRTWSKIELEAMLIIFKSQLMKQTAFVAIYFKLSLRNYYQF